MEDKGNLSNKEEEDDEENDEHESEEDESKILEESPCGRWLKRSEEISQRNIPGIDHAFLAMDSEEGVEVVWNEVQFSERKSYKLQEEKIKTVFDNLTKIEHPNIVNFHKYWIDYSKKDPQKTRVIFITEYMSSGSVKKFLNRTKEIHKHKSTKSWKKWCTLILAALSYLHSCSPPIIHGNLTCDAIFIQHNGLLKIGSVAPDAIRNHVKTYHELKRNMHYYAPEYAYINSDGSGQSITPAVDIFSFGVCALEMAVPQTQLEGGDSKYITQADIEKAIAKLENPLQRAFIQQCIHPDPKLRPSARELLLHPGIFEVHSLKLLAAHAIVKNQHILPDNQNEAPVEVNKEDTLAEVVSNNQAHQIKVIRKKVPAFDAVKYLEDVRNGIYPLTAYSLPKPPVARERAESPHEDKTEKTVEVAEDAPESRKIVHAQCSMTPVEDKEGYRQLILQLKLMDKLNRKLTCEVGPLDNADILTDELIEYKFINENDRDFVFNIFSESLKVGKTGEVTTRVQYVPAEEVIMEEVTRPQMRQQIFSPETQVKNIPTQPIINIPNAIPENNLNNNNQAIVPNDTKVDVISDINNPLEVELNRRLSSA